MWNGRSTGLWYDLAGEFFVEEQTEKKGEP
jgi:hypothetical protein